MRNQDGNVFIGSLIFVALATAFSMLVPEFQKSSLHQIKAARARSIMSTQELKIRGTLMSINSYVGCGSGVRANCQLAPNATAALRYTKVPGCSLQNPSGAGNPANCGVLLINESFNPSTLTYTATLAYNGSDVSIKNTDINFTMPPELLQSKNISCGPGTPLFAGFGTDGSILCNAIPGDCPVGQYASGFNPTTLQPVCINLPGAVNCAANEIMDQLTWNGGTSGLSSHCSQRTRSTVEAHFSFTPSLVPAAAPSAPAAALPPVAAAPPVAGPPAAGPPAAAAAPPVAGPPVVAGPPPAAAAPPVAGPPPGPQAPVCTVSSNMLPTTCNCSNPRYEYSPCAGAGLGGNWGYRIIGTEITTTNHTNSCTGATTQTSVSGSDCACGFQLGGMDPNGYYDPSGYCSDGGGG